jgi:hypothetical protein
MKLLPDFKTWTTDKWVSEALSFCATLTAVTVVVANNLSWWYLLAFLVVDVLSHFAGWYEERWRVSQNVTDDVK